jgi:hypothetical protein
MGSDGRVEHYFAYGAAGTPYFGQTATTTLTGGTLGGQLLTNNSNYLGVTNDLMYYADGTGGVIRYTELFTPVLSFDATWTALSGGQLNGQAVTRATGLHDFGGNVDISDNYLMMVETNGTLGYYFLDSGAYTAAFDAAGSYGSWTTFTGGALAGLTLNTLNTNATGSVTVGSNTTSYRYLGNYDDVMLFDIQTIPEASSALLGGLSLLGLALRRRR